MLIEAWQHDADCITCSCWNIDELNNKQTSKTNHLTDVTDKPQRSSAVTHAIQQSKETKKTHQTKQTNDKQTKQLKSNKQTISNQTNKTIITNQTTKRTNKQTHTETHNKQTNKTNKQCETYAQSRAKHNWRANERLYCEWGNFMVCTCPASPCGAAPLQLMQRSEFNCVFAHIRELEPQNKKTANLHCEASCHSTAPLFLFHSSARDCWSQAAKVICAASHSQPTNQTTNKPTNQDQPTNKQTKSQSKPKS